MLGCLECWATLRVLLGVLEFYEYVLCVLRCMLGCLGVGSVEVCVEVFG